MPFPPSRSFPLTKASTGQGGGRVISDGWVLGVSRISKRLMPIKLWKRSTRMVKPELFLARVFVYYLLPGWDADAEWKREVQDRFCVLAQLKDWCHGSWHHLSGSSLWSKESTEKRYEVELKKRGDAEAWTHKGLSPERVFSSPHAESELVHSTLHRDVYCSQRTSLSSLGNIDSKDSAPTEAPPK